MLREQTVSCTTTKASSGPYRLLDSWAGTAKHSETVGKSHRFDMQPRHFISINMESVVCLGFPIEY